MLPSCYFCTIFRVACEDPGTPEPGADLSEPRPPDKNDIALQPTLWTHIHHIVLSFCSHGVLSPFIFCDLILLMSFRVTMSRVVSVAAVGAAIAALVSQPSYRSVLAKWTGVNAPGGVWRILALLFALMNFKNLPFVWHVRSLASIAPSCKP